MTVWLVLMLAAVLFSAVALVMTVINLALFGRPPAAGDEPDAPLVSVCVPARNEEHNLEPVVRSILASRHANLEVLVYDDESEDRTAEVLRRLLAEDERVRSVAPSPLPAGWIGKQHACWRMSEAARGRWLLFTDADVRFAPECVGRALAFAERTGAALVSTFPREMTGTVAEAALVPLIHFVLFSYLPFPRMRASRDPSASAGCGQFLLIWRDAYDEAGGHAAVRDSMHEGVKLPRLIRRTGAPTDLFDGTDLLSCRMYHGLAETWRGFVKNAYEGLGSIWLLVLITVMHVVGHVLPWLCIALAILGLPSARGAAMPALVTVSMTLLQRMLLARRFRQPLIGVLLHPFGVAAMTIIQWQSLVVSRAGRRTWRGRAVAVSS